MRGGLQSLIVARDWIGLRIEVADSPNKCEIGIAGEVVDETANVFKIITEKGLKLVAKRGRTFRVMYMGKKLLVKGDLLVFRPEERIKRGLMLIKRAKGVRRWEI